MRMKLCTDNRWYKRNKLCFIILLTSDTFHFILVASILSLECAFFFAVCMCALFGTFGLRFFLERLL